MKIRNGFVSNSSSSSFCIYGTSFEYDDFMSKLNESTLLSENFIQDDFDEMENGGDWNNLIEFIEENTTLEVILDDEGGGWMGRSWFYIGDNETGMEFKNNVKTELEKIFGSDIECETVNEVING